MKRAFFLLGIAGVAISANAQQIADRTTLNSLLVSSTTDDFENYNIGFGNAVVMNVSTLDSTTIVNGQGPGLVNPGATYSDPSEFNMQWNGDQYFSLNTQSILSSTSTMRIDYAGGVGAMGFDAKSFVGFGYNANLDIMSGATLLGTINFSVSGNPGDSVFVGWQSTSPITHVILTETTNGFGAIIDDHTYGAVGTVPEPASLAVLGLGALALVRRRRK